MDWSSSLLARCRCLESTGFDLSTLDAADASRYRELAMSSSLDPKSVRLGLFRFHDSVRELARECSSTLNTHASAASEGSNY